MKNNRSIKLEHIMNNENTGITSILNDETNEPINGVINEDVTVKNGERLDMAGTINGNLTIEQGGEVYMTGLIRGDVTNNGGKAAIIGKVTGNVLNISGATDYDISLNLSENFKLKKGGRVVSVQANIGNNQTNIMNNW
jgi:hypothetical protein